MFKSSLVKGCLALALMAGSATANANEFKALLADIDFGTGDKVVAKETPAVAKIAALPQDVAAPAPQAEAVVEAVEENVAVAADEVIPAPVVDAEQAASHAPSTAVVDCNGGCGSCQTGCNSCNKGCLGNRLGNLLPESRCQAYQPPRLPTSTFYQNWRSNACFTNVWDGYGNRCPRNLDLHLDGNRRCGCKTGNCNACSGVYPAHTARAGSCDTCDQR